MMNETQSKAQISSHAFIISSPDVGLREKKALELACGFICEENTKTPCLKCRSCRSVLAGYHPDVIEISRKVDDKGKQKREIQVEQIRLMAADAYVRPSQAESKVYLIKDAGFMNVQAQNAALKILEEPPAYAVFILCADSAEALLATVRSRCTLVRVSGEKAGAENELAEKYISLAAGKNPAELCAFFGKQEALDTEKTAAFVSAVRFNLSGFLSLRKEYSGLTREDAFRLLSLCDRVEEYLRLNVGSKHIMGLLCADSLK